MRISAQFPVLHGLRLTAMLAAWVFAAPAPGARADTSLYNYYIQSYPHAAPTCQAAAAEVARSFAAATGLPVFSTACDDHQTDYFVTISYAAAAPLTLESTFDPNDSLAQGGYLSLADCQSDQPAQVALYRGATGLTPVVAFCFPEGFASGSDYGVKLRIDGFGSALGHFFAFEHVIGTLQDGSGGLGAPPQSVALGIGQNLAATGLAVSRALVRTDNFGIVTLSLQYYGAQSVKIDDWEQAAFEADADCEGQAAAAGAALAALADHPLGLFCGADSGYAKLSILRFADARVRMDSVTGTYQTLALCLADKDRVLANARATLGWQAGGAICAGLAADVRVFIFHRVAIFAESVSEKN